MYSTVNWILQGMIVAKHWNYFSQKYFTTKKVTQFLDILLLYIKVKKKFFGQKYKFLWTIWSGQCAMTLSHKFFKIYYLHYLLHMMLSIFWA